MNNQNANNQTQKKSGNGGLVAILAVLLVLLAASVGCYLFGVFGNEPILSCPSAAVAEEETIVGRWRGDIAGETVVFKEDGTCTIAGTNWDYEYKDGELTVSKYGFGYTVKADLDGDSLSFTLSKIKYDLERID